MKKPSLAFELEGVLRRRQDWVHISELEDFGRSLGFLSSNVDRRLRELRKAGKITSVIRENNGHRTTWWSFVKGINAEVKSVDEVNEMFPGTWEALKQISIRL